MPAEDTRPRGDGVTPTVAENRGPADRPAPYAQVSAAIRGVVPVDATTELQANGRATRPCPPGRFDRTDGRPAATRFGQHAGW